MILKTDIKTITKHIKTSSGQTGVQYAWNRVEASIYMKDIQIEELQSKSKLLIKAVNGEIQTTKHMQERDKDYNPDAIELLNNIKKMLEDEGD